MERYSDLVPVIPPIVAINIVEYDDDNVSCLDDPDLDSAVAEAQAEIIALLRDSDSERRRRANEYITALAADPAGWRVTFALALGPDEATTKRTETGGNMVAEPPSVPPDVRFFALNMLLSKVRLDWMQLSPADAQDLFEGLLRDVPRTEDNLVRSRLCIVVGAVAALAGPGICWELLERIFGNAAEEIPPMESSLALELLTALAEETLLRLRAHYWEVGECMQESCPNVLKLIQEVSLSAASANNTALLTKAFKCLERWRQAGITISELETEYNPLLMALLESLGSHDMQVFDSAVNVLGDLITEVDVLPGREAGARTILRGLLGRKVLYIAAAREEADLEAGMRERAYGLVSLISAFGIAEASMLLRGGDDAFALLDWLVDATAGGGGLGLEGASMAGDVWPKLSRAGKADKQRIQSMRRSLFGAVLESLLRVAALPLGFVSWEESIVDKEDLLRFREDIATEALAVCFKELGTTFLARLEKELAGGMSWQGLEVALFAAGAASEAICAAAECVSMNGKLPTEEWNFMEQDRLKATTFISGLFAKLPGAAALMTRDRSNAPAPLMVSSALQAIERFAGRAVLGKEMLEAGVTYAVNALHVPEARGAAASALRGLCSASAPHLAAARSLVPLMGACEEAAAAAVAMQGGVGMRVEERVAIMEGLVAVAGALPFVEAESALARLSGPALSGIQACAASQNLTGPMAVSLAADIRIVAALAACGNSTKWAASGGGHPAMAILQRAWPAIDEVASKCAGDADVAAAICHLWGTTAREVGVVLAPVVPQLVNSAVAMFRQHQHAACVDCLSEIVAMVGPFGSSEMHNTLSWMLSEVMALIPPLEQSIVEATASNAGGTSFARAKESKQRDKKQREPLEAMRAVCGLARSFLHWCPSLLLPSPAFLQLCHSAIGCVKRGDIDSTYSALMFLAEAIQGVAVERVVDKEGRPWQLPEGLRHNVDTAMGFYGAFLIEELLKAMAGAATTTAVIEMMGEVMYGLCSRYRASTEAAMLATLKSIDFPARIGTLTEMDKQHFAKATTKDPLLPKPRFIGLISDFSQVCRAHMPADFLTHY